MKKVIPELKLEIILDIIYACILPFFLGIYILKRKYQRGCSERIGWGRWKKIKQESSPLIWIHAVSLGEARVAHLVYSELKKNYPHFKYLLTTITSTGEKYIRENIQPEDYLAYLPLDFSFLLRGIFSKLNLKLLLILETELWPNLIILAKRKGIASGLINARISNRSFPKYKLLGAVFRRVINCLDFIWCSGHKSLERFLTLGCKQEIIKGVGNLKLDIKPPQLKTEERIDKLATYCREKGLKLLVAGSTHRYEDLEIVKLYLKLKQEVRNWALLIAPRYPEQSKELLEFIKENKLEVSFFSQGFPVEKDVPIFILDETGYLSSFYNLANLVFVGGSLYPYGGHNIIEPAFFKKAIFIGPYFENFEEIVEEFQKKGAILILNPGKDLFLQIERLVKDEDLRVQMGKRAGEIVEKNRGAVKKVIKIIAHNLEK